MKTKFILAVLTICILTACKKDYNCECYYVISGTVTYTEKYHDTELDAKRKCDNLSMQQQFEYGCRLK